MPSEACMDNLVGDNKSQKGCVSFCEHYSENTTAETSKKTCSKCEKRDLEEDTTSLCEEKEIDDGSGTENDDNKQEFPEGGWGWIIVLASFFNSFIFDGIGSSFGVLFPYVHDKFQASAFVTSFAGSMFGAYLIMGSVAALLIKKFGFRVVSFTGGLMACISFVLASRCSNVYLFLLTYGLMGGASIGLVYLPSMVIVNGYFNKKRGITNGIISSGSGMGLLIMAPVINALLDTYSLTGAVLILAGVLLNICVFSSCFRNPKVYSNVSAGNLDNNDSDESESHSEDITEESTVDNTLEFITQIDEEKFDGNGGQNLNLDDCVRSEINVETRLPLIITPSDKYEGKETNVEKVSRHKDKLLCHKLKTNYSQSAGKLNMITTDKSWKRSLNHLPAKIDVHGKLQSKDRGFFPSQNSSSIFTDIGANSYLTGSISQMMHIHNQHFASAHQLHNISTSPLACQSLLTVPAHTNNSVKEKEQTHSSSMKDKPGLPQHIQYFTSHESFHSNHLQSQNHILPNEDLCSVEIIPESLGYSLGQLLKMVQFYLFCLGACLIQFGYPVPIIFLADLAASHGIPSHYGAIMISLIGCFNIAGRLLGGALVNLNFNPIQLNDIAMLLAAGLCFLCPLFTTIWSLCIFASLYGFLLGFFPPLQPLIIVKYFGIGSLASTFGFVTSLKGVAGLIGPPLAGWIYDVSLDYSISIVFAGVAFLLSVIVNEILVHITKRDSR